MYILNQSTHYTYVEKTVSINEEFVKNQIKKVQPTWSDSICIAKKVDIRVDKDMEVKINGTDIVKIKSEYGLTIGYEDMDVTSMVALTEGVNVYVVIGY